MTYLDSAFIIFMILLIRVNKYGYKSKNNIIQNVTLVIGIILAVILNFNC